MHCQLQWDAPQHGRKGASGTQELQPMVIACGAQCHWLLHYNLDDGTAAGAYGLPFSESNTAVFVSVLPEQKSWIRMSDVRV